MDGSPTKGPDRARTKGVAATVLCLALIFVAISGPVSAAETADTCAILFDFGNGRMEWVDVPVTPGMTGFDVFKSAIETLGLDETHTYDAQYGNTIQSIDGYAGNYDFNNPQKPYDFWRIWLWDDDADEWYFSNYLLDNIDPTSTPAIGMIYVRDPYIGPPAATPEYRDPWISSRGDFTNSGSALNYDPSGAKMKWQQDLGNGAVDAPIVSSGGKIFALTSGVLSGSSYTTDSMLFCLGPSGEELWSAPVGRGHQTASPLLWDNTVFVASADGTLYAFDQETGDPLWDLAISGSFSASPLEHRNLIIVVSDDGKVTAVKQDGTISWSTNIGAGVRSAPALFDNVLYLGGTDGSLYAISADGSGQAWNVQIGGEILGSPVALNDQVIVTYAEQSGSGGGVASVSYDGTLRWRTPTAYTPGSAAISKQGVVAISSQGLSMLALDGTLLWTTSYGSDRPGGSPVTVDGMTYLVTNETASQLVAIDDLGKVQWTEKLDPAVNVRASPSISDNMLYLASSEGSVIAFLLEGGSWTIPPVGLFSYTVSGLTAHLDASESYGGNGTLSFSWEFDDGQTATGVKVDHTFAVGGNHTVTLTVTDAAGTSRNITKVIDLDDPNVQTDADEPGKSMPAMTIVGMGAVAVILGTIAYLRWIRKER